MSPKILVTGGSGRLGNYICPFLKNRGYRLTILDVVPPAPGSACRREQIPFVRGSVLSLGDCLRALTLSEANAVVHLAAIREGSELQAPYAATYDPATHTGARFHQELEEDATMRTNVMGTYYLLDACRRTGVRQIVAASSYYVIGIGNRLSGTPYTPYYLPIDEDHPCVPEDSYGLSLLLQEQMFRSFSRAYGIRSVVLRLLDVFYPDEENLALDVSVPGWTEGENRFMNGTTYQYIDARDVAAGFGLALVKGFSPYDDTLSECESFFLATDTIYAEATAELIPRRWPGLGGMGESIRGVDGVISIEKAKRLLGYRPGCSWRTAGAQRVQKPVGGTHKQNYL